MSRHGIFLLSILAVAYGCSEGEQTTSQTLSEQPSSSSGTAIEQQQQTVTSSAANTADVIDETVVASEAAVAMATEEVQAAVDNIQSNAEQAVTDLKQQAADNASTDIGTAPVDIVSPDKPYQLVAGTISDNAVEGWKTYNGGGCGACHGKGGIGAVGPNLAVSVTQKLSKEQFVDVVTNGRSGTMMRPHKTNKRVMDNLDNLYAYLVARGDDVLGPGNLIKQPLGK